MDQSIAGDPAMRSHEYQSGEASSPKSIKEFSDLASVALLPVSVVAFGSEAQPVERLLRLQSAVAKGVHMVAVVAQLRFWCELAHSAFAALTPQRAGENAARGFGASRSVK
jgi:hypothetical protein